MSELRGTIDSSLGNTALELALHEVRNSSWCALGRFLGIQHPNIRGYINDHDNGSDAVRIVCGDLVVHIPDRIYKLH